MLGVTYYEWQLRDGIQRMLMTRQHDYGTKYLCALEVGRPRLAEDELIELHAILMALPRKGE
jgi:hypothetical protein